MAPFSEPLPDIIGELAQYERNRAQARYVVRMRRVVNGVALLATLAGGVAALVPRNRTYFLYHVAVIITQNAVYNPTVRAGLRELEALDVRVRLARARVPAPDDPEAVSIVVAQRAAMLKIAEAQLYFHAANALLG